MARRAPRASHPVTRYAEDVVEGRIVAGPLIKAAGQRHLEDLKFGSARGLHFDEERADAIIAFFSEVLVHPEGPLEGRPFVLEDFQQFIQGSVYGWTLDGERRYQIVYFEGGKGCGKTPLGAGSAIYALEVDGGRGTQVYCADHNKERAKKGAWADCKKLALASGLDVDQGGDLTITDHTSTITREETYSWLTVLSREGKAASGQRIKFALVDELHEHPSGEVLLKIQKGSKNVPEPLTYIITNSGVDRLSICYSYHEGAERVLRAGLEGGDTSFRDDRFFAYVCSLDEEDYMEKGSQSGAQISYSKVAKNPVCWPKANPGLGTILPHDYLEREFRQGLLMPSNQLLTLRLNACIWTDSASVWIEDEKIMAGAKAVQEQARNLAVELKGQPCIGGMDLSRTRDVSAFLALFPPSGTRTKWAFLEWYWVPRDTARERSDKDKVPYQQWINDGWMLATEGNVVDYDFIEIAIAEEIAKDYLMTEIVYDQHFATQLVTNLGKRGFTMIPQGQGPAPMAAPVAEIERKFYGGSIEHRGHPVTRWMFGNVCLYKDGNQNQKIDKKKSREKVDGPTALANAMSRAILLHPDSSGAECSCSDPKPDENGLCLICNRWTATRSMVLVM